jgi:hypothetical protein
MSLAGFDKANLSLARVSLGRVSFSPQHWISGLAVLAIAFCYMTRWLDMPLYPDEVALRLQRARYLADGPINFGLYPCQSNAREISLLFRPVAYGFSAFDSAFGWSLVHIIPLLGVMIAITTTLVITVRQRAIGVSLTLSAGLIGVAGSGLILMRGEAPILFFGTAILFGYAMAGNFHGKPILATSYMLVASFLALLAFFIHPQSLILLPVFVLVCLKIALHQKSMVIKAVTALSIICAVGGAWSATRDLKMNCPEFPTAEFAFETQSLPGLAKHGGAPAVRDYFAKKLERYSGQLTFKPKYDEDYLPGTEPLPGPDSSAYGASILPLNIALRSIVLFNLILAFCVLFYAALRTVIMLGNKNSAFCSKIAKMMDDPSPYLLLATGGYCALFIYDTQTAFYRASHIHFMFVMLNALALSNLSNVARFFVWPLGIFSVALSISSTLMAQTHMSEKFAAGWAGPSISQNTNWSTVRVEAMRAEKDCKIDKQDSNIVIDDMTYDAMRQHRHLMPITYLGFAYDPKTSTANWLQELLQHNGASSIIARCESFGNLGLKYTFKEGGICCLKL